MSETACSKSELDVFRPIDVQVAEVEGKWVSYYPCTSLETSGGVVEFSVPGTMNEVIDLNNISLYIRGVVKQTAGAGGANLTAAQELIPVNNFHANMIRHIDLSVNGQLITRSNRDYAYKDYLMKLTQCDMPGGGRKDAQLWLQGFALDNAGLTTNLTAGAATANAGAIARRTLIAQSRVFELQANPCVDFFQTDRSLLPGSDLRLVIYLNEELFYLMDGNNTPADRVAAPGVTLQEMELVVRRVQIAPSFINAMRTEIQQRDAIYPYTRREILTFQVGANSSNVIRENLFQGQLATRFFVAMVRADAYNGAIERNPLKFEHFQLREISLQLHGAYIGSTTPLKVNFAAKVRTVQAYRTFLESIGAIGDRALACPITHDRYCDGFTIFAFTRAPDLCHGFNQLPPQSGNLTLQLQFRAPLDNAIMVIVMAEYDASLRITKDNNVVTDFAI